MLLMGQMDRGIVKSVLSYSSHLSPYTN